MAQIITFFSTTKIQNLLKRSWPIIASPSACCLIMSPSIVILILIPIVPLSSALSSTSRAAACEAGGGVISSSLLSPRLFCVVITVVSPLFPFPFPLPHRPHHCHCHLLVLCFVISPSLSLSVVPPLLLLVSVSLVSYVLCCHHPLPLLSTHTLPCEQRLAMVVVGAGHQLSFLLALCHPIVVRI
jgi:hypothetical protein